MPIQVLAPEVRSKIAAGEVVERPASVVKELVENSLDAAASQVAVEVRGGGVRLIRVVDNGEGIPADEVEIAFERYATSKLSTAEDLESIASLGFRGEALPSIAAVAEVTLVSRSRDELSGTFLNVKEGAIIQKAKRGCPQGTTVTVRNLFRSFPARLKFLRSVNTENRYISQLVTHYSLAFPEVRFTLVTDGRTSFRTPGTGQLRDVLAAAYGAETAQALLEVGEEVLGVGVGVGGFVSPPWLVRSSRNALSFFVNRRWVQSRMLSYALEQAYEGLLASGRHPIAAINVSLAPQEVDVNVHPTKSEIKFRYEREVFSAVQRTVRAVVIERVPMPLLEAEEKVELPRRLPQPRTPERPLAPPEPARPQPPPTGRLPILRVVGQVANTYIVAEGPDGMYLIDQHAAHERVTFERLKEQWLSRTVEVQGLLEPLPLELSRRQEEVLKSHLDALGEYGFDIEPFGEHTYLVRAVPAVLGGKNIAETLAEVLGSLADEAGGDWREGVAISLACHGSVRAGQVLSLEEMRELVRQLEQTSRPQSCPHGRPTIVHLSSAQLDKEFGRK